MAFEFITGPPASGKKEYLKKTVSNCLAGADSAENIIVLTHSSKTAREIYEHIVPGLNSFKEIRIESVTSFCKKILRENYFNTELNPGFRIISDFEKRLIVRSVLKKETELKYFSGGASQNKGMVRELSNFTDIAKRNPGWEKSISKLDGVSKIKFNDLKKLTNIYDKSLTKFNFLDFVDIEIDTAKLLKQYPATTSFKKVFVYETEDMDLIITDIICSLLDRAKEALISFRGDAGIYDFRGGNPEYIEKKLKERYDFKVINLKKNDLQAKENLITASTRDKQAEKIASHIALKLKSGVSPEDIAVISRSVGEDFGVFTDALKRRGINYVLSGGIDFFRQPEILNLISLLSVIYHQAESKDIDIYRAGKMMGLADENIINKLRRKSLLDSKPVKTVFKEDMPELYEEFFSIIKGFRERAKKDSIEKFIYRIMRSFKLLKKASYHKMEAELYRYFFHIVTEFSEHYEKLLGRPLGFSEFMENLYDLLKGFGKDIDVPFISDREAVKIMTVQQSKGELFNFVYMVDMVEDNFPREFFENPLIIAEECRTLNIIPEIGISARYEYEKRLFNIARSRANKNMIYGTYEMEDSGTPAKLSSFISSDKNIDELDTLKEAVVDNFDFYMKLASGYSKSQRNEISEIAEGDIAEEIIRMDNIISFDAAAINDRVTEGLPDTYSYTKLENFVNCPRQFFYRYIVGLKEPESIYKIIGIATHKILSSLHKSGRVTYENMVKLLNQLWTSQDFYSEFESRNIYTLIKDMLENYIALAENEKFKVVSTEESFNVRMEGKKFTGRFDRIDRLSDGSERVVDYKTGKNIPAIRGQLNAVKRGESFQIPIYSMARGGRYFSIYRLRYGPDKMNVMIDFNDKDAAKALSSAVESIRVTISELEKGHFPPAAASACRVCYFKRICPVY